VGLCGAGAGRHASRCEGWPHFVHAMTPTQVKKQREKEPAWTEMVERLGGSVLPQVMRQIKKKARAAGKGDAADSEGKLKERSGVSSSKVPAPSPTPSRVQSPPRT